LLRCIDFGKGLKPGFVVIPIRGLCCLLLRRRGIVGALLVKSRHGSSRDQVSDGLTSKAAYGSVTVIYAN